MTDSTANEGSSGFTTPEGARTTNKPAQGITTEEGARESLLAQSIQARPADPVSAELVSEPRDAVFEATEVVANFMTEEEAQAALAALRSAGLLATLSGATPSAAAFSLFGRLQYAPMQISVPSKQAAEALRILAGVNEPPEAGWEDRAEQALDGWLCRNCDTVVDRVQSICPACGSHRDDQPTESDDEDRD